jgi:hypothetical protein
MSCARLAWLSLALAACGSSSSGGGPADAGGVDGWVAPPGAFTVDWGDVEVAPGQEDTRCVTVAVGNSEPIRVHTIHNQLVGGSHHLIVYKVADTVEQPVPTPCSPFADTLDPSRGAPIMITQKHDDTLTLPDGVAYTFAPGQLVRLEMHYINTTDSAMHVGATSTFVPMDDAAFEHEAGFLLLGTPDIIIGPGQSPTVGPYFLPMPAPYDDVTYFAITGHTHQYGTDVSIATATDASDTGTPIYHHEDWSWAEPPTDRYEPGFTLPPGGGFRFSCSYDNTSDQQVTFGESAQDEMCFFWAYYYPDHGSKVCFHTFYGGGIDACCPGDAICSQIGF